MGNCLVSCFFLNHSVVRQRGESPLHIRTLHMTLFTKQTQTTFIFSKHFRTHSNLIPGETTTKLPFRSEEVGHQLIPIFFGPTPGYSGISVESSPMCSTDRRTDRQTDKQRPRNVCSNSSQCQRCCLISPQPSFSSSGLTPRIPVTVNRCL